MTEGLIKAIAVIQEYRDTMAKEWKQRLKCRLTLENQIGADNALEEIQSRLKDLMKKPEAQG